jgi:aspartate/glutamate racemase
MEKIVHGGTHVYGQLVGILMMDSTIPRIPGDPGHAETFPFAVRYGVIRGFPFEDLIEIKKDHLHLVMEAAKGLEKDGVNFIAADCGLFSLFQEDVANALSIPFIGSSLNLIPLLAHFVPNREKIGVITGDTRILKPEHLKAAGAGEARLVVRGMENSDEFQKVVIERGNALNVEKMREEVLHAAKGFLDEPVGAVVLECTNLVTFRSDIQRLLKVPVFDAVSLIEFFAEGYRLRHFATRYVPQRQMTNDQ